MLSDDLSKAHLQLVFRIQPKVFMHNGTNTRLLDPGNQAAAQGVEGASEGSVGDARALPAPPAARHSGAACLRPRDTRAARRLRLPPLPATPR